MNHGWQSDSTDGPKVVGAVFSESVAVVAVVTPLQLLDVAWCNAAVVVIVVWWVVVVVLCIWRSVLAVGFVVGQRGKVLWGSVA